MKQQDFETLLADTTKCINGNITWEEDEDHSPTVEFRVEVISRARYPIFVKGSYNSLAQALTYALIHRSFGRIYALDMGKDHHNPSCYNVGRKHKHRWNETLRDKEAYVPDDITALVNDPLGVWLQFCKEALLTHNGEMYLPPPLQLELF
jgi:hypothetical protein